MPSHMKRSPLTDTDIRVQKVEKAEKVQKDQKTQKVEKVTSSGGSGVPGAGKGAGGAASLGGAGKSSTSGRGPSGGASRKRWLWIIPVALLVLVAVVYLAGVAYFDDVFLPGTTLDGEDVSLLTYEQLAEEKSASLDDYELHASGNGLDLSIAASDIDLTVDGTAYVEDATDGLSAWAWPLYLLSPRDLTAEATVTYDEGSLADIVEDAVEELVAEVESASITYSSAQAAFVLGDGSDASDLAVLSADAVTEAIGAALLAQETEVEIGDDCLESADSALAVALGEANALLGAAGTTLSLEGTVVLELDADQIAAWVVVGDDLSVSLDEDAVSTWVSENVGALDTVGASRTYTRADGEVITVSGGTYGIVTNESETTTTLLEVLEAGTAQAIELPLRQSTGYTPDSNGRDWGNRYIDVDLTEQYVRMYDDNGSLIWESACVTGDTTEGYDTPTGVYAINSYKATNQTLIGLDYDEDGEPDYTSDVTYWIPFYGNLIAFHDASWRTYFGGTIYQGNGSHGCINLPADKAAELYELTQIGDVVVVHY